MSDRDTTEPALLEIGFAFFPERLANLNEGTENLFLLCIKSSAKVVVFCDFVTFGEDEPLVETEETKIYKIQ